MTRRGDATRQRLLDTAEQLFAARGYHAVSLREIRIAAGARNTGAIQFHFGDRDGLTEAIFERHLPNIGAMQERLFAQVVADGAEQDARRLVEVLVRPVAEYLAEGPSAIAWTRLIGELSTEPSLQIGEMDELTPAVGRETGRRIFELLRATMPVEIAVERMFMFAQLAVQICADRARVEEAPDSARPPVPLAVFTENLIDTTQGALFAPVSPQTLASLEATRVDRARPARKRAPRTPTPPDTPSTGSTEAISSRRGS